MLAPDIVRVSAGKSRHSVRLAGEGGVASNPAKARTGRITLPAAPTAATTGRALRIHHDVPDLA